MRLNIVIPTIMALALGACSGAANRSADLGAPPPTPAPYGDAPTIFIAAMPAKVQQVIIARAAARGTVIKPSTNGKLVLERDLTSASPEVNSACGTSWFGRKVRVVMSVQPSNGGTQLTERRYIVGGTPVVGGDCALPLSDADRAQSMNAMSEVKMQAERP